MNYHRDRAWALGHLWSLAVEEQFYLLWPAVLAIAGARRGLWAAGGYLVFAPIARVACWLLFPASRAGIGETFETTADAIAAGCLLAGLAPMLARQPLYRHFRNGPAFILVPVAIYCSDQLSGYVSFSFTVGESLMNVGIALGLDWCITHAGSRLGRLLNSGPLTQVGALSYSLYLWQQPFLNRQAASLLTSFPFNLAVAVLLAIVSYLLVERTGLRLRERFARVPSGFRAAGRLAQPSAQL
jgi:peptidoglycan/LPS O-acetylase OafA/YrhL